MNRQLHLAVYWSSFTGSNQYINGIIIFPRISHSPVFGGPNTQHLRTWSEHPIRHSPVFVGHNAQHWRQWYPNVRFSFPQSVGHNMGAGSLEASRWTQALWRRPCARVQASQVKPALFKGICSNIFNSLFRGQELTLDDQMLVNEADEIMSRVGDPQGTRHIIYYKSWTVAPFFLGIPNTIFIHIGQWIRTVSTLDVALCIYCLTISSIE